MKIFYCVANTIRKILLILVLVLLYNSSIDTQEDTMNAARQAVEDLVGALHVQGAEICGLQHSDSYVIGYLTGILKDLAESNPEVERIVHSYLDLTR